MRTIAVINEKGGTAKTSTAHAIGAGLADRGKRVLFVDADPQGNLTYIQGASTRGLTIADLLERATDQSAEPGTLEAIQPHPDGGADTIASAPSIAGADTILADVKGREYLLKAILAPISGRYDYCVIDTGPTLGTLTVNALTAADSLIAPAHAGDVFSMTAIAQLYSTVETVKRHSNPALTFTGIVLTRYNRRSTVCRDVAAQMEAIAGKIGTKVFRTRIRECRAVQEAQIRQESIYHYAPRSNAAADYTALLKEILEED